MHVCMYVFIGVGLHVLIVVCMCALRGFMRDVNVQRTIFVSAHCTKPQNN